MKNMEEGVIKTTIELREEDLPRGMVVGRYRREIAELSELVRDLERVLLDEVIYGRSGSICNGGDQCYCDKHRLKRISSVRGRITDSTTGAIANDEPKLGPRDS